MSKPKTAKTPKATPEPKPAKPPVESATAKRQAEAVKEIRDYKRGVSSN